MKKYMGKLSLSLMALTIALVLSSCANKVPFSNEVVQNYRLTPEMIQSLQFFVSRDIVLERGEQSDEQKNTDKSGKLVISSAANLESITIPKGTEGVCLGIIDGNKLKISFESDDKYLIFGDPNNRGRYTLMAAEWNNGKGKLQYGGKVYYAQPGAASAYLIIQMKKVRKFKKESHVVGGRKVNR